MEFWLFIIVGAIAVASAVLMLLSDNAVYSALFLILVMACMAFLFLLLEAPFLAMIQITVYAGAIMVLFIFVIMLLGAERTGAIRPRFNWLTPLAVVLSAAFLLVAGIGIIGGEIDTQQPTADEPLLRVVHAATDAGPVDVYANDVVIASNLTFDEASPFVAVQPGEYTITLNRADGGTPVSGTFTFGPDTAQTLVAYGVEEDVTLSVVPTDLSAPDTRNGRVTFFNAYPLSEPVTLVDLGVNAELDRDVSGELTDRVILEEFAPGEVSDPLEFEEGDTHWAFVAPNGEILSRVVGGALGRSYELERETTQLVILSADRSLITENVSAEAVVFRDEADAAFGSPEAIGVDMLTQYLLPFELVSLLLLAAMVGAIVLTHKEEARARDRSAMRRRVSRPLASVISAQVGHEVTTPESEAPALPPSTTAGD